MVPNGNPHRGFSSHLVLPEGGMEGPRTESPTQKLKRCDLDHAQTSRPARSNPQKEKSERVYPLSIESEDTRSQTGAASSQTRLGWARR